MIRTKIKILAVLFLLSACSADKSQVEPPVVPEDPEVPEKVEDVIHFTLVGVGYELPVSFETLINDGWTAVDNVDGTLEPHKYISDVYMRKGTNLISVSLHNNTDTEQDKLDSLVAAISAENRTSVNGQDQPVDIQLKDSIDFSSSEDEINSILGEPVAEENEVFRTLTYQHNKVMKTEIKYQKSSGDMRWITIQNFK